MMMKFWWIRINKLGFMKCVHLDLLSDVQYFFYSQSRLVGYRDRAQQMTILDPRPLTRSTWLWDSWTFFTFVRILLGQVVGHLQDDVIDFSGVLLDAQLLLRVEVRLDGLAQHDLGEDVAEAVRRLLGVWRGKFVSVNHFVKVFSFRWPFKGQFLSVGAV